jgi:hypothetical protein
MTIRQFLEQLDYLVNYINNSLKIKIGEEVYKPCDVPVEDVFKADYIELLLCGWKVAIISYDEIYKFNDTSLRCYADLLAVFAYALKCELSNKK